MATGDRSSSDGRMVDTGPVSARIVSRILDNLDGIVYVADLQTGRIIFANTYLKKLFGFDPTGRNCKHLLYSHHDGKSQFTESSSLIGDDGKPVDVIYREYLNPFNKKWYGAKAQAIEWTDGRYVRLEVALDITEQKQLERFLDEARKQVDIANSTKNRFVALVAHDLKSPFVSILGMLKRILSKEKFEHEIHRTFLENIIDNGHRMLRMIDNLLDMERLEAGNIRPEQTYFDVSEMINEVFHNFAHLAHQKKLVLQNHVPYATEIYADKYLYFVVLNNLISNAVKFSFVSGIIDVRCEKDEKRVRLLVTDQGKGIPESYHNNIFRPDVKTTSAGTKGETGSGLGLLFCQQIMKAHGGSIGILNGVGKGTTFYVELCPSCRLPGDGLVGSGGSEEPD